MSDRPFRGAKAAIFIEDEIIVYRRDDTVGIPYPAMLDLPGGGREDEESAFRCLQRETEEEFGIEISEADVRWKKYFPTNIAGLLGRYFFVACIDRLLFAAIKFGAEGQMWTVMTPSAFIAHPDAIESLKQPIRDYQLWQTGSAPSA